MFILDDVLSAVDAQVARCILDNAILGPLMKQQTRVLCTHNVQVISMLREFLFLIFYLFFKLDPETSLGCHFYICV